MAKWDFYCREATDVECQMFAEIERLQGIERALHEIVDYYEDDHDRSNCDDAEIPTALREGELALKAAEAEEESDGH